MIKRLLKGLMMSVVLLLCVMPVYATTRDSVPGTYQVELTYTDERGITATKIITVSVLDDGSPIPVVDPEEDKLNPDPVTKISDYILEASNFTLTNKDLFQLSDEAIISLSGARAFDPVTNETIPIHVTNRMRLTDTTARFDLTADTLTKSVVGTRRASAPVTETITWEDKEITHDRFSALNQVFFASSFIFLIVIPLLLLAVLYCIYYRYKKKTQDTLYK